MYTDNNPLSYIQSAKLGATEMRWVSQLAQVGGNRNALGITTCTV